MEPRYHLSIFLTGGQTLEVPTVTAPGAEHAIKVMRSFDDSLTFELWGEDEHLVIERRSIAAIRVRPPLPEVGQMRNA